MEDRLTKLVANKMDSAAKTTGDNIGKSYAETIAEQPTNSARNGLYKARIERRSQYRKIGEIPRDN